ncbi:MAG: polysaccharide biosynthesis/export family protein [Sphingomicrobium sp.]
MDIAGQEDMEMQYGRDSSIFKCLTGVLIASGALLSGGCHTVSPAVQRGPAAYAVTGVSSDGAPETAYYISAGDVVDVTVLYEPELSLDAAKVDSNGDLQVPLVGKVHAGGQTAPALAADIQTRLGERYLRDPQVTVNIATFSHQNVTVEGQVIHPGVYDIPNSATLLQSLALAQGPTRAAALNQVIVFRTVGGKRMGAVFDARRIRYGYDPDPRILAGDVVIVGFSELKGAYRDFLAVAPAIAAFRPF